MLLTVFDLRGDETPQTPSFAVCLEFVVKRWLVIRYNHRIAHFFQCVETCAVINRASKQRNALDFMVQTEMCNLGNSSRRTKKKKAEITARKLMEILLRNS